MLRKASKTKKFHFDSSTNQCKRLLQWFEEISPRITVGEAREKLFLMSPPARILDLRRRGYKIETHWFIEYDAIGNKHKNGIYVFGGRKNDKTASQRI